jgi:competence protein ComEC
MRTRLGPDADEADAASQPVDLRLVPAAVAMWLGVLAGLHGSTAQRGGCAAAGVVLSVAALARVRTAAPRMAIGVTLVALLAGMTVGALRAETVRAGPVAELAAEAATVRVDGVLTTDPSVRTPESGQQTEPYVIGRLRVEQVTGRGTTIDARTPVLLVATDTEWAELLPGSRVTTYGRLAPADGDLAALLRTAEPPSVTGPPSLVSRATEPLRQGLRDAVDGLPEAPRGLVPGLAIGDDENLPVSNRDDMRATGLTHLTAVSGVHVGIVLVAAMGLARRAGVRGYALPVLAVVTLVGFALLVRPDPSVVRASTMGMIGVLGLTVAGRKRALPALAAAVLVLLLVDPWLGRSIGFTLSVLSTAGILVLAPVWRDAMPWLPRTFAESLAVPLAAQVASIPVLVAFVSETSLASVPANILAAPAVAPATLLGVVAAVTSPILPGVAVALAWLASWPATWIALVAEHGAALPGAVLRWPGGVSSVVASVVVVIGLVLVVPQLFRRPLVTTGIALAALVVLVAAPSPGWPPRGWLVVACPIGQGDAFVLNAGGGAGVVVDAGPEPATVDRCLDDLGIVHVPLLVLTHFHADHVDGVPGVLDGRRVDEVMTSPLPEPAEQAGSVHRWLADADVAITQAAVGEERVIGGSVHVRVVWPSRIIGSGEPASNDSSVVLDATVGGVRVLLTGDIEQPAQQALLRAEPTLRADVLKVPHHGSRTQEPDFLAGLGARTALIGVGEDNRHGHPAPETIELLERAGTTVWRTDTDGAVAVIRMLDGSVGVATRGAGVFAR